MKVERIVNRHLYTHHLDSTFCHIRFLALSVCLRVSLSISILFLLNYLKLSCRHCYISLLNTSTLYLAGLMTSST